MNVAKWIASKTGKIVLVVVVLLIGIRIALPYIVLHYVNKTLDELPEYDGHVEDVDLHLYRGAYEIQGIEIVKTGGKVPVPFFSATSIDLSVEWKALLDGALVAEIEFLNPKINFVAGPTKETSQKSIDVSWQEKVKELFPLRINSFKVINGQVHYRDLHNDPKVDIYLQDIYVTALNLTNSMDLSKSLVASIDAEGGAMGSGRFKTHIDLDPYAKAPTFNLDMSVSNVPLVKMNDFLRAYGNFDVERGTFGLYGEIAAEKGRFTGYLKPIFKELKVISWKEEHKNVFQFLWEAVVGTVAEIFENQPKEQIATRIPLSGSFKDPEADIWSTIGTLFKNAFIQALIPGIEQRITFKSVDEKPKE